MSLTNFDDDKFDQEGFPDETLPEPEPERKSGNRNFIILISILGVIFVLALILLLLFAPKFIARQRAAQLEQAAQINAYNTATALAATSAVNAQLTSAAKTSIALTPTVGPTKTPVVVIVANTPVPETTSALSAAELATVSVLQTQMAAQGGGGTAAAATSTATALPNTGFADDFGLPMMAGMGLILVLIIILSRKLRTSSR